MVGPQAEVSFSAGGCSRELCSGGREPVPQSCEATDQDNRTDVPIVGTESTHRQINLGSAPEVAAAY